MEFRVLGPLEVREDGQELPLGGEKQRALLALLVLNAKRVVSRERLIDELWGEEPPDTAVSTVQVYVSRLRKLLGAETLATRSPGYMLVADADAVDEQRFGRLGAQGREALAAGDPERAARALGEALALWRGPALGEFPEASLRAEGARLEDLRLAAVEDRIEADLQLGRSAELVGELEALIAEQPQRERLRGQLMRALYRSGRQADALEAYRDARAALDEVGLAPSEELRRLERSILTQDASLEARTRLLRERPALPSPLALRAWSPFVGRARELSALQGLLDAAARGEGQVALIAGEAGAGKSRLMREFAREAAAQEALVLYGGSDATVNVPYKPFVEALEFLVRASNPDALQEWTAGAGGELARLVPNLGPVPAETSDTASARPRLHSAVAALLAQASREQLTVVILEDVHWADAASLELLCDLARGAADSRLLFLATHRDRSEDMRPEFTEAIAALARVDGNSRIHVGALSGEEVAEFIRRATGADGGEVATALHGLTDGTAFLLCELWRDLVETGTVETSDGTLRLTRPVEELASPQAVRAVTQHRLSRLSPATTEVMELGAVVGATFDLRVLQEAVGHAELVQPVEEALASGTIEELPGRGLSFRFSHELVRRALYDRLSSLRRAQLHLRVGEALERAGGGAAELAHHFAIAAPIGGAERAVEYNLRAAEAAVSLFAFADAEGFAVEALGQAGEGTAPWARAQYLLATAELYVSKSEADVHAAAAAAAFAALGDVDATAEAEILHARVLRGLGRAGDFEAAAERAFALVRDRPPSRVKAAALIGWSAALSISLGRYQEAAEYAREALAIAEQLELVPLQADALNRLGLALSALDEGGEPELERAIALGRGGVAPDAMQGAYTNLGIALSGAGRLRDVARLEAEALAEVRRYGFLDAVQFQISIQVVGTFNRGQWRRAEELMDEYRALTANMPSQRGDWFLSNVAAYIALARGDDAVALAEAEEALAQTRRGRQRVGRTLATVARVHAEQGRPQEAGPLVDELMVLAREMPQALRWRGFLDLGWLLHDLGRPELPPAIPYPFWNEPAQAIARGELEAAAELLAATDLLGEAAYACLRAAELLAGHGRRPEMQAYAERAAAFYRSVGATAYLQRAEAALAAPTAS